MPVGGRLEYIIDLKDAQFYADLRRDEQALQAFAKRQQAFFAATGAAGQQSGAQVAQGMRTANDAVQKHGKDMHNMLGMIEWRLKYLAVSSTVYAGMAGIGAVTAALTLASKAGIEFNAMMEQVSIAFTTLLDSAGKAADMIGQLYGMAARSPFEFTQFAKGAQSLLAMGVAGDEVEKTLRAIGDATAAVGGSNVIFERMIFNLGQIVALGRITSREMRDFAMSGLPAWKLMAEQMGITVAEARKMVETVGIPASEGIPALIRGIEEYYGGMMEKMADTWAGVTTTIKDNIKQMMGEAEGGLFSSLKDQLIDIREWLTEFNEEARRVGFMTALHEQAPMIYEALQTISISLKAVGNAFRLIPPEIIPLITMMGALGVASLVFTKMITGVLALGKAIMGLHAIQGVTTAWQAYNQAMMNSIAMGQGWMVTMRASITALVNPMAMLGVAAAGLAFAFIQYKKHLDEVKAAQQAAVDGAKTLVTSLGGSWVEVAEEAGTAAARVADFAEQNREAIRVLGELSESGQRAFLFTYALEMQARGMNAREIQDNIDKLARAAGLSIRVPVGIDREATLQNFIGELDTLLPELTQAYDKAMGATWLEGGVGWKEPGFYGQWKVLIDSMIASLNDLRKAGDWPGVFEFLNKLEASPPAFHAVVEGLGETAKIAELAEGGFNDLFSVMSIIANDRSLPVNLREMAVVFGLVYLNTKDTTKAMAEASAYYQEASNRLDGLGDSADQAADAMKALAEEAAKAWAKELEQQYDVGSAINRALRERQQVLNEAAEKENEANRKAAEQEKKAIDKRADDQIKAIERVRDARLADLKAQEDIIRKQKGVAESIGDPLGIQIADDAIAKLKERQDAVSAAAEAEKEAIRERAQAEKDAVETIKVAAQEASLSVGEITAALAEAAKEADTYMANLAQLPADVAAALRDSGLTPEQKRKLAEELVVGSVADREAAFEALRTMADRRSEEAAQQWGEYEAKMTTLAGKAGQSIVDSLVGKLTAGGRAVGAAVEQYRNYVANALNPILETLGASKIPMSNTYGGPSGVPGAVIRNPAFQYAMGGLLPNQATIQDPVNPIGLVQWAETETGGEAFIPLSPQKRARSMDIWEQVGQIFGVFANGGFLPELTAATNKEIPETPYVSSLWDKILKPPTMIPVPGESSLSIPYSGNVAMDALYQLGLAFLQQNYGASGAGASVSIGGRMGGMQPTTTAVWRAYKAHDPTATFMGGYAKRPYKSDHTTGHAYDAGGPHMQENAGWLAASNPGNLVKYIIHNPLGKWNPKAGWRPYVPSAAVIKFAGSSAWHRDHVHVSTYAQGGIRDPFGIGLDHPLVFADGGITGTPAWDIFKQFTGGEKTLSYTSEQAARNQSLAAEYTRSAAAMAVYRAQLEKLAAIGASAAEQLDKLNQQIAATSQARYVAQELYYMAKAAGASDEQLAQLKQKVVELDIELARLEKEARKLSPAVIAATAQMQYWGSVISQLTMLMDMLGTASDGTARQLAVFPQLIGAMGAQMQAQLTWMQNATTPEEIMNYGNAALQSVSAMFNSSKAILDRSLSDTLNSISKAENDWNDAWQDRADAVRKSYDTQQKTRAQALKDMQNGFDDELKALTKYYDDQLAVMDARERDITREQQRNAALRAKAKLEDECND